MKLSEGSRKSLAAYAIILGILYTIIGLIEFATGLWNLLAPGTAEAILGLPIDLFGGFATLVIGATYFGAIPLWRGDYESLGFILVGVLLSVVFGVLHLLIVGADGFGTYLEYLDGEVWTWEWLTFGTVGPGLLRPEIWLSFLSVPLGYFAWRVTKTK
jgi:hypothetical protein